MKSKVSLTLKLVAILIIITYFSVLVSIVILWLLMRVINNPEILYFFKRKALLIPSDDINYSIC
jgi:hypothetical protein